MKVCLHMYNANLQQNPQRVESCVTNPVFEIVQESVEVCTTGMSSRILYAQHPITKNLHFSPRFSTRIFLSRCKFSTPTSTPRLYAQNPVFEIVGEESVKVWWCVNSRQTSCRSACRGDIRGCKTFTLLNPSNIIPSPLSHGRMFATDIRTCWIPNTTITKRNIQHISDWSKCTVFYTPEPKLMQHTD